MSEYEEQLMLLIRTKDESTAVVKKIGEELDRLKSKQDSVRNESRKTSKAIDGIGDAFGLIIKRSPYVMAADFVARLTGVRNLMGGLNAVMDAAALGIQNLGKAAVGITPDMERSENLLKTYREQYEALVAKLNDARGIRPLSFGLTAILPANIQGLPAALKLLAEYQEKINKADSVEAFRAAGGVGNRTSDINRFAYTERTRLAAELNEKLRTMSKEQEDAARSLKELADKGKEEAAATEKRRLALEALQKTWKQTSNVAGTTQGGSGVGMDMAKTATNAANFAASWVLVDMSTKSHAKALAEANQYGAEAARIERGRELTLRTINRLGEVGKSIAFGLLTISKKQEEVTYNIVKEQKGGLAGGFERINAQLDVQKRMWEDIAYTVQYNVGAAIGNILTDISDAEDILKNLLRALQSGINMALGQAASSWLFSAKGNMFSGGNVVPFARGGMVNGPTTFPLSGGRTGLMGEAGPEIVMPVTRNSRGEASVHAVGGGTNVQLTLNVGSLDPRGAADVILANVGRIGDALADAIAKGSNRNLRSAVAGVR